jgi:hypothetical protein
LWSAWNYFAGQRRARRSVGNPPDQPPANVVPSGGRRWWRDGTWLKNPTDPARLVSFEYDHRSLTACCSSSAQVQGDNVDLLLAPGWLRFHVKTAELGPCGTQRHMLRVWQPVFTQGCGSHA